MITFWILWIFNALMALIPIFFFGMGLGDGSVDGNNILMWLGILVVVGLLLGATYWLKTKGKVAAAKGILWFSTVPCLLAVAYFAIIIFGDVRWN